MATTLTMAGQLAIAGAARLGADAGVLCQVAPAHRTYRPLAHQVVHQATWTKGAVGFPTTSMVFGTKNRNARPLSELSP